MNDDDKENMYIDRLMRLQEHSVESLEDSTIWQNALFHTYCMCVEALFETLRDGKIMMNSPDKLREGKAILLKDILTNVAILDKELEDIINGDPF